MKKIFFIVFCSFSLLTFGKTPEKAVYELIERITPGYARQFRLELIQPENGNDVYEIDSKGKKVVLRGNNAVSLATAYNRYLKYTCHAHVSGLATNCGYLKNYPCLQVRSVVSYRENTGFILIIVRSVTLLHGGIGSVGKGKLIIWQ